ncbi:hypothetical protein D3C75_252570 [compost metagenome]
MQGGQPLRRQPAAVIANQDKELSLRFRHINTYAAALRLSPAGIPGMLHTVLDNRLQRHFQHFDFHINLIYIQLQMDGVFKPDIHNLNIILDMADFIPQLHIFACPFEVVAHHAAQPGQGI